MAAVCYQSCHGSLTCLESTLDRFIGFSFSPNSDFRNLPFLLRQGYGGQALRRPAGAGLRQTGWAETSVSSRVQHLFVVEPQLGPTPIV
jgi:hypothetical protein